jgi:DNA-binding NarL/FixJ family response regulator
MILLMLCDDKQEFLDTMCGILSQFTEFSSIVTASSGEACIELIENGNIPDILLLDISMPNGMSGYEVARDLTKKIPALKIIAFTMLTDELAIAGMIRFNVKGFMMKDIKPQEIVRIIKKVLNGEEYYPPKFFFTPEMIAQIKNTPIAWAENITHKELRAMKLLSNGLPRKQAAAEMNISESALAKKITRVFNKTITSSTISAINFLVKVGLIDKNNQ